MILFLLNKNLLFYNFYLILYYLLLVSFSVFDSDEEDVERAIINIKEIIVTIDMEAIIMNFLDLNMLELFKYELFEYSSFSLEFFLEK